jgi:hypothetical protein
MRIMSHMRAFGVGSSREASQIATPSNNHAKVAGITKIAAEAKARGFRRVAGNTFICESTKDFWGVKGDKLVRLTIQEVDNGERIDPGPVDRPQNFMNEVLGEIEF